MYTQFRDHADFLTIYIREAHPQNEWQMDVNVKDDVCYAQPRSLQDRIAIANDFVKRFHYPVPLGVDTMADTANKLYGGWPERLYILAPDGTIVYKGGMGPFNYRPEEVLGWLRNRFPATRPAG